MIAIKHFPELRQAYEYDCGATALQSVLIYYGFDFSESEIMKMVKTTKKNGTKPENIFQAAKKLGIKAKLISPLSLIDLKAFIDQDIPVIIELQAWSKKPSDYSTDWTSGHYVVAIGYDRHRVYFEDPAAINRTHLSFKELLLRWHDRDSSGRKYYNLGIALAGKKKLKFHSIPME